MRPDSRRRPDGLRLCQESTLAELGMVAQTRGFGKGEEAKARVESAWASCASVENLRVPHQEVAEFDAPPQRGSVPDGKFGLYAMVFLANMGWGGMSPVLTNVQAEFRVSVFEIALANSVFGMARLILDVPIGLVMDWVDTRLVRFFGAAVLSIRSVICALAGDLSSLLFGRFLHGVAAATTEIFGPVVGLLQPAGLVQATAAINHGCLGNMASIFTSSGALARKFRYEVEAGNVGVNMGVAAPMAFFPFSGWKESFFGVDHGQGMDAVDFFTQKKVVVERWPKEWTRRFVKPGMDRSFAGSPMHPFPEGHRQWRMGQLERAWAPFPNLWRARRQFDGANRYPRGRGRPRPRCGPADGPRD